MSQSTYDSAALALPGISRYYPMTELSGSSAVDSVNPGVSANNLTWGADVSGFLTTGPDGLAQVPVNNGSTNRVGVSSSAFAPSATATYFWWQRQDVNAADNGMVFELANSPTFSQLVQALYGGTTTAAVGVNYGNATASGSATYPKGTTGTWYFYCLVIDVAQTFANQVKVYRDGTLISTNTTLSTGSQASLTPTSMNLGVLGRNNNGTRGLPIKAAMCGFGITNTVLTTGAMGTLRSAMVAELLDRITLTDSTSVSTTQGTLTTPVAFGPGVFLFGSQIASWRNPADTITITDSATRSSVLPTVAKVRFSTTVTGTKTALGAHDELGVPPFTVPVPGVLEHVRFTVLSRASSTTVRFPVTVAGQKGTRAPATATLKLSTVQAGIKTGPGTTSASVRLSVQVTGIKSVTSTAPVSVRFTTTATGTASIVQAGASTGTVHLAANATGTKIGKTAAQTSVRFSTQATGIATPAVLGTSASLVHLNATAGGRKTAAGATTTTVAVASVVAGGRRTGGDADETVRFAEFATGRQGTTGQWPGAHRGRIQRPNHGRVR